MLLVDTNISRVADWGVEIRKPFFLGYPSEQNFPMERFNKYLALLKEAGGKVATRGKGEHPDPGVMVWVGGLRETPDTLKFAGLIKNRPTRFPLWMDTAPSQNMEMCISTLIRTGIFGRI